MNYVERKTKELEGYLPPLTRREDFHAFWAQTRVQADAKPLNQKRTLADAPMDAQVYDIVYDGFDGTPIHGWLLLPQHTGAPHPCIIHYHGFTGNRGNPWDFAAWLLAGFAVISVDCREQGGDTGSLADYSHGMVTNVVCKGILDKNEYYYRAVYMDCVRALDFALTCPEIDPARIAVEGGSQGGALGMAVAALDSRPALCIVDVPSNSNLEARVEGNFGSFSAVHEYIRRFPDKLDAAYETLSYFDNMNMSERITCPVFASVGLEDDVCPAKCYFASYNRIIAPKQIEVYPFSKHEGGESTHTGKKLAFAREHLL